MIDPRQMVSRLLASVDAFAYSVSHILLGIAAAVAIAWMLRNWNLTR